MGLANHYGILGVERDATEREIKKSYRRLALDTHPDRHPGDKEMEERFKKISEAYAVLSNPAKRRAYDAKWAALERRASAFWDIPGFDDSESEMHGYWREFYKEQKQKPKYEYREPTPKEKAEAGLRDVKWAFNYYASLTGDLSESIKQARRSYKKENFAKGRIWRSFSPPYAHKEALSILKSFNSVSTHIKNIKLRADIFAMKMRLHMANFGKAVDWPDYTARCKEIETLLMNRVHGIKDCLEVLRGNKTQVSPRYGHKDTYGL